MVKSPPANSGDVGSVPGLGDPLEEEMATHSSIFAWRIPWTEEPGGLPSMGSQSRTRLSKHVPTLIRGRGLTQLCKSVIAPPLSRLRNDQKIRGNETEGNYQPNPFPLPALIRVICSETCVSMRSTEPKRCLSVVSRGLGVRCV